MRKEALSSCPCCGQTRGEPDCRNLLTTDINEYFWNKQGERTERVYRVHLRKAGQAWACDECLQSGLAIKANIENQHFYDGNPHFAYFDKKTSCRDCNKDFIFSKEEQRHWYEKLKLMVYAQQVRCNDCRASKKRKDRFNLLLSTADYNNSVRVEETVGLGVKLQQYQQARHFLAVGKRKYKKKSTTYKWLEKLELVVEKAEHTSVIGEQ
jgi:hypothetical protein